MKKLKILIFGICLILLPISAKAATISLSTSCNKEGLAPGESISCDVYVNTDAYIKGAEAKIVINTSDITITSFTKNSDIWSFGGLKSDGITLNVTGTNSSDGLTGKINLGVLNLSVSENIEDGVKTVNLQNFAYVDKDNQDITVDTVSSAINFTVTTIEEEILKGLKSLACTNGCVLSPQFNSTQYAYTIVLGSDTNSFSVSAIPNNATDTIEYMNVDTGTKYDNLNNIPFTLAQGKTVMQIRITVGSGSNQVIYTLTISKEDLLKGELSNLKINDTDVSLINNIYYYTEELEDLNNCQIKATLKDNTNFTLKDNDTGIYDCSEGGLIKIIVVPKEGVTGQSVTYQVVVNKKGEVTPTPTETITTPTPTTTPSNNNSNNPSTGSASTLVITILTIALITSIYLFKKYIPNDDNV